MTIEETVRAMDPAQKVKIGTDGGSGFWFCGRAREFLEGPEEMRRLPLAHRRRSLSEKGAVILLAAAWGSVPMSGNYWTVNEAEQRGTPWAIMGRKGAAPKTRKGRGYGEVQGLWS